MLLVIVVSVVVGGGAVDVPLLCGGCLEEIPFVRVSERAVGAMISLVAVDGLELTFLVVY